MAGTSNIGGVNRELSVAQLFTCFNCSAVKDSLWIVSYVIDINSVDECLCCAECLSRNFKDARFTREHRIVLRCGGDGCNLKLECWTKSVELIVSLLKEHTDKCPFRPIFCPRSCQTVIRRQDLSKHEESCPRKESADEKETARLIQLEKSLRAHPRPLYTMDETSGRRVSNGDSADSIRREALSYSRCPSNTSTLERKRHDSRYVDEIDEPYTPRRSFGSQKSYSGTPSYKATYSDETLEQLEKARKALELSSFDIPDGLSFLPDVVAQRLNNDDKSAHERLERTEELLATTRAQLEKAFSEIRQLRQLVSTENKLRELNQSKMREEIEFLRNYVRRSSKQKVVDGYC